MNMRIHINKKLAEIFFLILLLLCMYAEAHKDTEFVHQEIRENQQRLLDQADVVPAASNDRGSIATSGTVATQQNITNENNTTTAAEENKPKEFTFWSGFVDSLSMIFFVEFGDRVFFQSFLT